MHAVTCLSTLLALATTALAGYRLETDVFRYPNSNCAGPALPNVAPAHKKVKSDKCETYGGQSFDSYMYTPHHKSDGGYRETSDCNITGYTSVDCTGTGFSLGNYLTTMDKCVPLAGAKSIYVFCEDLGHYWGGEYHDHTWYGTGGSDK